MGFQNVRLQFMIKSLIHITLFYVCRYDKDGSGSIEIDEMVEIVGNLFELEGLSKVVKEFWTIFFLLLLSSPGPNPGPNRLQSQIKVK